MRRNIGYWALLGAITIGAFVGRPTRAVNTPNTPAVVVLDGEEYYQNGLPVAFVVATATSSTGAPVFHRGDNLAEALATLREQGYTISIHNYGYLTYTATK